MILWIALFILVIAISFVFAYQSMRDFHLTPTKMGLDYGLFLIRNPQALTEDLLDFIKDEIAKDGLIVSLERLFKGKQTALVIFGPKQILIDLTDRLNLLELEDYTQNIDESEISAWEVGLKNSNKQEFKLDNPFENLPELEDSEQFWWQVNLKAYTPKTNLDKKQFLAQIRCICLLVDYQRRKKLADELANLGAPILTKVPKPFTSQKILEFYKKRSLIFEKINPNLTSTEVLKLVEIAS